MTSQERSFPASSTAGPVPSIAPTTVPDDAAGARLQSRLTVGLFIGYLLFAGGLSYFRGGTFLTPDRIAILLLAGAAVLGQGKAFIRDWGPFVLLLFGYELMRGVADNMTDLGALTREDHGNIQVEWLIDWDRALFFGHTPSIWLQDRLYKADTVHWYDALSALIYLMHFVLPLVFAFMLWLRSRDAFRRFTVALLVMSYGAFIFFLLLPTAPPWMAQEWGYLDNLERPSYQAYKVFLPGSLADYDTFKIWTEASPNPVAAFPSLHAAFPWLVMLFAFRIFGKWGWLLVPYNAALWFSVVYLSQHWVVDAIAGAIWASAIFVLVEWFWARRTAPRRRPAAIGPPGAVPAE
jgi:membrane-associated phospholipid phosphatase